MTPKKSPAQRFLPLSRKFLFLIALCVVVVLSLGLLLLRGGFFQDTSKVAVLSFSGKNAYMAVKAQTDFGPRVPGTEGHRKTGDWIFSEMKKISNAHVIEQKGEIDHPLWKKKVSVRNFITSFNPESKDRVLLSAHWDTRPFGENDPLVKNQPISGANDGASGVAVLIELARVFEKFPPKLGVDLLFWDFEDTGEPQEIESYCLGSKYWAMNPHVPNYQAMFGINLDMVGGFSAEFPREQHSNEVGAWVYDRIQNTAQELGYGQYFPNRMTGQIYDDHLNVIRYRSIPMVDLIHVDSTNLFFPAWHTLQDRIETISPETLEGVGRVVAAVVYGAEKEAN
jgi:glutaminyl-peptide cyclotransferase